MARVLSRTMILPAILLFSAMLVTNGCGGSASPRPTSVPPTQAATQAAPRPAAALSPTATELKVAARSAADIKAGVANSKNLDGLHQAKGIACESCHGPLPDSGAPKPPDSEKCLSCHGGKYETLAAKTVSLGDKNPHDSHQGSLECAKCHHVHRPFESYCQDCHSFGVPDKYKTTS